MTERNSGRNDTFSPGTSDKGNGAEDSRAKPDGAGPDGAESNSTDQASRILLLMSQPGNRRILHNELGGRYEVTSPEGDGDIQPADLVVTDGLSFKHQRANIEHLKASASAYLPVLLILSGEKSAPLESDIFDIIDEVIHAPIGRDELRGRIRALLRTRQYALDARQKVEELASSNEKLQERERALRRSEQFLKGTIDAISAHLAVLDEDGTIIRVNDAWNEFAARNGADPSDVGCGTNYLDVCRGPDGGTAVAEAIRNIIAGNQRHFEHEYPCHGPDEKRWFNLKVTRFVFRETPFIVVLHQNITRRKQYEIELVGAKERAEEMNRLKSAFLANMSHEIRTPLTPIIGFAELLKDEIKDDDALELITMIHNSAARLKQTLTSVLDLAQLESKSMTLQPEQVELASELAEITQIHVLKAEEKGIDLRVDLPPRPVPATIDPGAFQRVVFNVVSNAVKFTGSGHVRVRLEASDREMTLTVADTGIGIRPEVQEKIFQAFKQESEGLRREYEGSGLGLAITKQLVEMMGGTIEVESVKGEGATFTICLPRSMRSGTSA